MHGKEVTMRNPKSIDFVKSLEKLLNRIDKSGIKLENVSMQDHYILDRLTSKLHLTLRDIQQDIPMLRTDLLRVLADHLESGKLQYRYKMEESTYMAEFPILFPDNWQQISISLDGRYICKTVKYLDLDCPSLTGKQFFFGLTDKQYHHLFYVYNTNPEWGGVKMNGRTGRTSHIKHIRDFCDYFEKGGFPCA